MASRLEAFFVREWQRVSVWQVLLQPLAWLFAFLAAIRRLGFKAGLVPTHRLAKPVVIVGNISVGGTGKTPLVLALVKRLQAQGNRPGIVTRGYTPSARKVRRADRVDTQSGSTLMQGERVDFSDEAALLAQRTDAPVYVGANRLGAATRMLADEPDVNVVLSDDGLQHYRLQRDLEIAVVDAARAFGNGFRLPAGPLREPVSRLTLVDCVVLNSTIIGVRCVSTMAEIARQVDSLRSYLRACDVPIFEMTYGNERMVRLINDESQSTEQTGVDGGISPAAFLQQVARKRVTAVAGIGNPERFFDHLGALGIKLTDQRAFPDHHPFAVVDLSTIEADIILMTEKDAVKCYQFDDPRLWMMRVDAKLPDTFYEFVLKKLDHVARSKTA